VPRTLTTKPASLSSCCQRGVSHKFFLLYVCPGSEPNRPGVQHTMGTRLRQIAHALTTDASLAAFHTDDELAQAVLELEADRFEVHALETLRNILPDGAEAQEAYERQARIERGNGGGARADAAEPDAARAHCWFLVVGRMAQLPAAVETLLFIKQFESRAEQLEQQMREQCDACRTVLGSHALQELLALVFHTTTRADGHLNVAATGATIQQLGAVAGRAPAAPLDQCTHAGAHLLPLWDALHRSWWRCHAGALPALPSSAAARPDLRAELVALERRWARHRALGAPSSGDRVDADGSGYAAGGGALDTSASFLLPEEQEQLAAWSHADMSATQGEMMRGGEPLASHALVNQRLAQLREQCEATAQEAVRLATYFAMPPDTPSCDILAPLSTLFGALAKEPLNMGAVDQKSRPSGAAGATRKPERKLTMKPNRKQATLQRQNLHKVMRNTLRAGGTLQQAIAVPKRTDVNEWHCVNSECCYAQLQSAAALHSPALTYRYRFHFVVLLACSCQLLQRPIPAVRPYGRAVYSNDVQHHVGRHTVRTALCLAS